MISHRHRTIFVHVPKCGGQSVEQAFLDDLGLTWADRAPLVLGRNPARGIGPPRLAHLSARDYTAHHFVSPEIWEGYFTFALVRDPAARAVSLFNHLAPTRGLGTFIEDWLPAQFALAPAYARPGHGNPGKYHFTRPQADFLTGPSGLLVDAVYRLEEIETRWPEIARRAGLAAPLPHRNASENGAAPADLTDAHRAAIARLYAADYALLGYDPRAGPGRL